MKKKIEVKGLPIAIESVGENDYVSLTDLARHGEGDPTERVRAWLRNTSTLLFLDAWEQVHNPGFKVGEMAHFIKNALSNRTSISAQKFIEETGAVGLVSKQGRYGGGTWAHSDIALNFCYWLSPPFQVYFVKEFQRLKRDESERASVIWAAERVKDLLDEARNWMDMVQPPAVLPGKT